MSYETESEYYNLDDFLDLKPGQGYRYELVEGQLRVLSRPKPAVEALYKKLQELVETPKQGRVWWAVSFVVDQENPERPSVYTPDIIVTGHDQILPDDPRLLLLIPPLVVECITTEQTWYDVEEKVIEYQKAGVPLVWVLSLLSGVVFVYKLENGLEPQAFGAGKELEGADLFPALRLPVDQLFE